LRSYWRHKARLDQLVAGRLVREPEAESERMSDATHGGM
jgi:hypothetical protein